ncbi:uncharacterized protein PADG_04842 [Paracoccidioides brasiliensis Pb18]|uniref:Uncharacterized protein n=1 Tax=Paracoccidioides brasiliensis (strain Pb18) TaxID=502780 RepID=C1GB41_PARBD|nr:uncharacterized protein PADG_04842 [Paracoccidioides brasiliensis Pb18]EEH48763.2 hypothetical protein PADG_04842 [Paracoccidioides brasiliensis Pb18]
MSQHQSRGLPVPQRLSSLSSSNESITRKSDRSPLYGLNSILAEHSQGAPRYTVNNNIIVDNELRRKFGKTVRTSRQFELHLSSANREGGIEGRVEGGGGGEGRGGGALSGNLSPRATEPAAINSQKQLRQRASSPLLGDRYQNKYHELLPSFHAEANPTLRVPESPSALCSSHDPLTFPSTVSQLAHVEAHAQSQSQTQTHNQLQNQIPASYSSRDLTFRNNSSLANWLADSILPADLEPSEPYSQAQKTASKVKHRPPMIDLSHLFPKPSDPAAIPRMPLLSPHRLTMSPSPISLLSDTSFGGQQWKLGSLHNTGNKLTKTPSIRELAALRKLFEQKQQQQELQHRSSISPQSPSQLYDQSLYGKQHLKLRQKQQQVPQEKESFFQRQKRDKKRLEEEQPQRQVQQEKEHYFQRQKREKQRREEEEQSYKRQKEEQRLQEQRDQLQLKQLQKQRQSELQSQSYEFPFQRKRPGPRKKAVEWFDGPEGQVSSGDDDDDNEEPDNGGGRKSIQYATQTLPATRQPAPRESIYSRGSSNRASVNSNALSGVSRASSRTLILSSTPNPVKKYTPESHNNLSPFFSFETSNFYSSPHDWEFGSRASPAVIIESASASEGLSRKSSKTALNRSDLNEASVLCLSSSEDESEEGELGGNTPARRGFIIRDSIATFDEEGSEICTATAKAVAAARGGPVVSRIRSANFRSPRASEATEPYPQSLSRNRSNSSILRSPNYRPSNGIPTISEPEEPAAPPSSAPATTTTNTSTFDFQLPHPQPRPRTREGSTHQSPPPTNRRSRFIAVTRQEEQFLEAIRRQHGNIPPSFSITDTSTPRTSNTITNPPRKSPSSSRDHSPSTNKSKAAAANTSFLALSPELPQARSNRDSLHVYPTTTTASTSASATTESSERSLSHHHTLSVSDGDRHSNPSPTNKSKAAAANTSFLALSPELPQARSNRDSLHVYPTTTTASTSASATTESSERSLSHHHTLSVSDGDRHSNPSPCISLMQSDTLPSSSKSWASPRTPTVKQYTHPRQQQHQQQQKQHNPTPRTLMHAQPLSSYPISSSLVLSTLSARSRSHSHSRSPSPPPLSVSAAAAGSSSGSAPAPVTPDETKRHSRSRTDSSDAMAFGDGDVDYKRDSSGLDMDAADLPIWAVGWGNETPGLAVVH